MSLCKRLVDARLSVEPLEDRRLLAVMSFQDGVLPTPDYNGTRDAAIFAAEPDVNFGEEATLQADAEQSSTNQPVWSLLEWDLSSIPAGSKIQEVDLTVNITNTTVAPGFDLFEMKTAWSESVVTWNAPTESGTWEEPGATDPADAGTSPLGTLLATSTGELTISLSPASLAVVQKWVATPEGNHGFLLANAENGNSLRFDSSEATTKENRPKLQVVYLPFDGTLPTASLASPQDNGPGDENPASGEVRVGIRDEFRIQLTDERIDDASVTAATVAVSKDGAAFEDFTFSFDAASDVIAISPNTAAFTAGSYELVLSGGEAKIADAFGNQMAALTLVVVIDESLPTGPIGESDQYNTDEDTPLVADAEQGVLDNDFGGNDQADAVLLRQPDHGELTLNADGSFTYTPQADFFGEDGFSYTIQTPLFTSGAVEVTISVRSVEDVPIAVEDSFRVFANETLVVNDDPLDGLDLVRSPENGHFYGLVFETTSWFEARAAAADLDFRGVDGHLVTITSAAERIFLLDNFLDFVSTDARFHIGLTDWRAEGDHTWITDEPFEFSDWFPGEPNNSANEDFAHLFYREGFGWTWNDITGLNDYQGFIVEFDTPLASPLLENDRDAESDPLSVASFTQPQNGTLVVESNGSFVYTPNADFVGEDSFTYVISDGDDDSAPAMVTINVERRIEQPVAVDDAYRVAESGTLRTYLPTGVLANDTPSVPVVFQTPFNLAGAVNSSRGEWGASISADGLTIYFHSNRAGGLGNTSIWQATRTSIDARFKAPTRISEIDSNSTDAGPSISADGLTLYFSSKRGNNGDIWQSKRSSTNRSWNPPERVAGVNSAKGEGSPSISADGLTLFFSSNRDGQEDLWQAVRSSTHDPFGEPTKLSAAVNSAANDSAPSISADGLTVFFTSVRGGSIGSTSLWMATRPSLDRPFGEAESLGIVVNSEPTSSQSDVSIDGRSLYFSSARPGGRGSADIWVASVDPNDDPRVVRLVDGPEHGTLELAADGSFTYTAEAGFSGQDQFTYTINDGLTDSNIATTTIIVGSSLSADLTGNGFVDFEDLTVLLAAWNQNVSAAEGNLVDADGTPVNFEDLTVLLAAWTGPGAAGAPVGRRLAAAREAVGGDSDGDQRVGVTRIADGVASYKARRDGRRSRSASGIYGRLQAVAVDRAMAEDFEAGRRAIVGRRAHRRVIG